MVYNLLQWYIQMYLVQICKSKYRNPSFKKLDSEFLNRKIIYKDKESSLMISPMGLIIVEGLKCNEFMPVRNISYYFKHVIRVPDSQESK